MGMPGDGFRTCLILNTSANNYPLTDLRPHLQRLSIPLLPPSRQPHQSRNQLPFRQVLPESPRHVLTQRLGIEPRRVEDVPVISPPQLRAGIFGVPCPVLPLRGAMSLVIQRLPIETDTVARRCDQPALLSQSLGKMAAGAFKDVMGRLVKGDQVQLQLLGQWLRQGNKAHEGMQVMSLALDLLDPPLQFTAQAVAGKHGRAIAMGNAPKHFIQQVPTLFALVAASLFELGQQGRGDPRTERTRPLRQWRRHSQQIGHRTLGPCDIARVDTMAEQRPSLVAPRGEIIVTIQGYHDQSPICTGLWGSRNRARRRPLRICASAGR